jgi:hypothetical protein
LKLHPSLSEVEKTKVRIDFGIASDKDEICITERAAFRWILEKKWYVDARTAEEKSNNQQNRFYKFELNNLDMIKMMEQATN